MIFDELNRRIKEMKELRRLETIKANRVQQEATDIKYHNLVSQVNNLVVILNYVHSDLDYIVPDSIKVDVNALLEKLQDAIKTGYADKDIVSEGENDFKNLVSIIKKDWQKYHSVLTSATVNTLKILGGIESEQVEECLTTIKNASTWQIDLSLFEDLKEALDNADFLIQKMNLDQDIITFLSKMTNGKATFGDLNEKVIEWIRIEALQDKIRLTFASK